jgi:hypothetical protein
MAKFTAFLVIVLLSFVPTVSAEPAPFTAFLPVAWCYTCAPQQWITANIAYPYETLAQCQQWLKGAHTTSSSWDAEAKDKHHEQHKPWCLAAIGPAKPEN